MKKIIVVCLLLAFMFSFSTVTLAQPPAPPPPPVGPLPMPPLPPPPPLTLRGGLKAGYYRFFPLDSQLAGFYKGQIMFGASLGAMANNGLELQLDVEYSKATNAQFSSIDLEIIPVLVTMRFHPLKRSPISPFVGAGVGIYYLRESSDISDYIKTFKFGTSIVLGADIRFHESASLRIEARRDYVGDVSNDLYYKANFGGFKATVGLIFEIPIRRTHYSHSEPYHGGGDIGLYERRIEALNKRISDLEAEIDNLEELKEKHYWGLKYDDEDDLKWEIRRLRYKLQRYKGSVGKIISEKEKAEHDAYIKIRKEKKEGAIKTSPPSDSGYKTEKTEKKESKEEKEKKKKSKEEEEHEKYIEERLKRKKEAKSKSN